MAAVQGPFPGRDDPRGAVARACARQGVLPEHVEVEPLDYPTGCSAWHWRLTSDAPAVVLRDVLMFDEVVDRRGCTRATGRAHHPRLICGVVIEVDGELLVVADDEGDGAVEDLIAAGMREAASSRS